MKNNCWVVVSDAERGTIEERRRRETEKRTIREGEKVMGGGTL